MPHLGGMKTLQLPLTPGFRSFALGLTLAGLFSLGCAEHPPPQKATTLRELYHIQPVSQLRAAHTALVLVDFQEEFFHGGLGIPDGQKAVAQAATLLTWARRSGVTVVHVRNIAAAGSKLFAPGSPTTAFVPQLQPAPAESVITKPTGGAFTKTDLDARLRAQGIDTLVVAGIMAHLAVAMTAQDGAVLGYRVIVASDATATRDLPGQDGATVDSRTLARVSLAATADRFADVMPTQRIVWLSMKP